MVTLWVTILCFCCFYYVKTTKAQDQGLLKSVRSLFLNALDCNPSGYHGHPLGDHAYPPGKMHV